MNKDYLFEVFMWPEVQELMDYPDFYENSCLISGPLYKEFGDSSFLVRKSWLDKIHKLEGDYDTNEV